MTRIPVAFKADLPGSTGRLKAGALLLNGWTDFNNSLTLERWGQFVVLRGVIKAPPADVVTARGEIMTIPVGFRPTATTGIEYLGLMSLWDPPATPLPSKYTTGIFRSDSGALATHANKLVSVGTQIWTTSDAFPAPPYI